MGHSSVCMSTGVSFVYMGHSSVWYVYGGKFCIWDTVQSGSVWYVYGGRFCMGHSSVCMCTGVGLYMGHRSVWFSLVCVRG